MKNIVVIKNRTLFHMDRWKSARFTNGMISEAIQVAVSDFIKDRYDNIKDQRSSYSFESVQRIRDEIRDVVKPVVIPMPTKSAPLPVDYMHEVGVEQEVNGIYRNSIPKTISERLGGNRNVYQRASPEYPTHEEIGGVINCYCEIGLLTNIRMHYIKTYPLPEITNITSTAGVNAVVPGVTYHVEGSSIVYDGNTYQITDTFTAGASTAFTGGGTVRQIVEVPLGYVAHEEIALRASAILQGVVENFNKNQLKEAEVKKQ